MLDCHVTRAEMKAVTLASPGINECTAQTSAAAACAMRDHAVNVSLYFLELTHSTLEASSCIFKLARTWCASTQHQHSRFETDGRSSRFCTQPPLLTARRGMSSCRHVSARLRCRQRAMQRLHLEVSRRPSAITQRRSSLTPPITSSTATAQPAWCGAVEPRIRAGMCIAAQQLALLSRQGPAHLDQLSGLSSPTQACTATHGWRSIPHRCMACNSASCWLSA